MATTENNWEIIFLIIGWNLILLTGVGLYHQSFNSDGTLKTPTSCTTNCTNINNPPTGAIDFLEGIVFGLGDIANNLPWYITFLISTVWVIVDGLLIYRLLRSG